MSNQKVESTFLLQYYVFYLKASLSRSFIVPSRAYFISELYLGDLYNIVDYFIYLTNFLGSYVYLLNINRGWSF
jgi:hypothetical protein